jgi:hypothetical protein
MEGVPTRKLDHVTPFAFRPGAAEHPDERLEPGAPPIQREERWIGAHDLVDGLGFGDHMDAWRSGERPGEGGRATSRHVKDEARERQGAREQGGVEQGFDIRENGSRCRVRAAKGGDRIREERLKKPLSAHPQPDHDLTGSLQMELKRGPSRQVLQSDPPVAHDVRDWYHVPEVRSGFLRRASCLEGQSRRVLELSPAGAVDISPSREARDRAAPKLRSPAGAAGPPPTASCRPYGTWSRSHLPCPDLTVRLMSTAPAGVSSVGRPLSLVGRPLSPCWETPIPVGETPIPVGETPIPVGETPIPVGRPLSPSGRPLSLLGGPRSQRGRGVSLSGGSIPHGFFLVPQNVPVVRSLPPTRGPFPPNPLGLSLNRSDRRPQEPQRRKPERTWGTWY